ncbi:MAG TPA: hypothetical protein VKP30_18910, partial [Polyangiaceae bacterium]|nr:hypothetical protein [Polyangiaceae bacterium]
SNHITQSLTRPILIIDEAQEMPECVFSEVRMLTSKDFEHAGTDSQLFGNFGYRLRTARHHPANGVFLE